MRTELEVIDRTAPCCPIGQPGLLPGEAEEIARRFKALADPTRVRILNLLISRGGSTCVCDLNAVFDLAQPTISHHLGVLRRAGLVQAEQRGTWRYYAADRDAVRQVASILQA